MAWHSRNLSWKCLTALLLAALMIVLFSSVTAEAAQPRVAIVGFTSRVHKTDLTLTDLKEPLPELLSVARDQLTAELAGKADYYVFGYLTTLGKVKAQSGALGLSGRDKTVYAELSLRVMDAHTGAIVFVTKADSRRKAELSYNAIWQRHDSGEEDAIRAALEDAAVNLAAQFKQAM
ncbi:hypothetical protein [Mitsuokella multacida]|uniref:hypothetical protein n=1 Tax=Mitsuokella multacida TaxID=52226 RepID=UPI0026E0AD53|nr:hypothetical protein [Mitsuokella multacida]